MPGQLTTIAGPRQAAVLLPGMGDVHFSITTADPLAQKFFDQGVGQLHGFWYFEAERSFRQVAALDPALAAHLPLPVPACHPVRPPQPVAARLRGLQDRPRLPPGE